ncbi:MAG: helix-turn-helix domain-containing protein [Desulfobulbales bacterium]|nr:helix-turn-helix domain-containing protein [Desulfobulbales bacterium]
MALQEDFAENHAAMLAASRESITGVLRDFLAAQHISPDRITLVDGFLFLFNDKRFCQWHTLNWWDQRKYILAIKDHKYYRKRAYGLLSQSSLAPFIDYSDQMVAKSNDQDVKRAWMRKRLVLKECFWNAIDTVSFAAYFQKKFQQQYPVLCLLLCKITDSNGDEKELFLGIDNGIGFVYKKKSRESSLIRLLYKIYKFFFRKGVFYIGGLELGLLETESRLSCHGAGAVVYQGW